MAQNLDYNTLFQLAQQAGFSGTSLYTIVAIALRESGGNPEIGQDYASSGHVGLLQLSQELQQEYGYTQTGDPLTDATQQFQIAYAQYQRRGGFYDWGGWFEGGTWIPVPTSPANVVEIGGSTVAQNYPSLFSMFQNVTPPPIGPSNNNGQGPNIPPENPNGPFANGIPNPITGVGNSISSGIQQGFQFGVTGLFNGILALKNSAVNGLETIGIGILGIVLILGGVIVIGISSNGSSNVNAQQIAKLSEDS